MNIGLVIMNKRKALGYTQQTLAEKLNVSIQVSVEMGEWNKYPEMKMLLNDCKCVRHKY